MSNRIREEGFYPIKNEKGRWEVVRWAEPYWFRTNSTMAFPSNWFQEIGERIILPS